MTTETATASRPSSAGLRDVVFLGSGGDTPGVVAIRQDAGKELSSVLASFDRGYSVYSLAISPDGSRLAVGSRTGMIRVYPLQDLRGERTGEPMLDVFHGANLATGVLGLAFVTDDFLASGGEDGRIRIWDVTNGRAVAELAAHTGCVTAICAMGSLVLASIGTDAVMRVWDLDTLTAEFTSVPFKLPKVASMVSLEFDAESGLLLHSSGDGKLHVYDTKDEFTTRAIEAHRGDFCALACGTKHIATAGTDDMTIKIWPRSLERPIAHTAAADRILALTWIDDETVLAVNKNGTAQRWRASGEAQCNGPVPGSDVRTCIGWPAAIRGRVHSEITRAWRAQQITLVREQLSTGNPDAIRAVEPMIAELHRRGFCTEAVLLVAEWARAAQRPLWELETLLRFVHQLEDDSAAFPSLYAIGNLLASMKEPALAIEFFDRVFAQDSHYRDTETRLAALRSHALLAVCPESCVRGDFGNGTLVAQEIEKYTILGKRFDWSVVFDSRDGGKTPGRLSLAPILDQLQGAARNGDVGGLTWSTREGSLLLDREQREAKWLYACGNDAPQGLCYALDAQVRGEMTHFTTHAIFDPSRSIRTATEDPVEHNRLVRRAWEHVFSSSTTRAWLAEAHDLASKAIKHASAGNDHGW